MLWYCLSTYKVMKRTTFQACSLKHSIKKVCFLFMANWTHLSRIGGGFLPLPCLHAWKYADCLTENYRNTIHHNEIMIFCGTVYILYQTGNRLRMINRVLLSNLRLSTKYQKIKVDSARWHSWSEELMLKSYATTYSLSPTNLPNRKTLNV